MMFKQSNWIWHDLTIKENTYGWFFKTLDISHNISSAILNISAHNHFKLLINHQLVSGYVTPAPSAVNQRKLYLTYDIKPYLKKGENLFEVVVLYLGGSGQNYVNGIPGFILEAHIKNKSQITKIYSDETWMAYKKTPFKEGMPFQQSRHITASSYFDQTSNFKKEGFKHAIVLKGYPFYDLQKIGEGSICEQIKPVVIYQNQTVVVYDMGRIISGFVKIDVKTNNEVQLMMRYSEDLKNHRVKHHVANEYSEHYCDCVKIGRNQSFSYQPDFTYKAFRYVEITGDLSYIDLLDVYGLQASTDFHIDGYLASQSYPEISALFKLFKHTQRNNILGLLVDCPHREQAQYLGDSLLQLESLIYNVKESGLFLEKVLVDFSDMQDEDGTFPFVAPGSTDQERFNLKIPEYDLYFIELVYILNQLSSDKHDINRFQKPMKQLIDHYISYIDDTGLVKKTPGWHISDWPYPTVNQEGEYLTYENMLFYRVLKMYVSLYNHASYEIILKSLKVAIIKNFKTKGLFSDSLNSNNKHQGIQAFALLNGFYGIDETDDVLKYIVEQGFDSSIILSKFVIEALFSYGYINEAFEYIFSYEKGWGHIIEEKSPTMWEGFDNIESHSHAWGLYPLKMIQKYVLGVKFVDDIVEISPAFPDELQDIEGSVITTKGLLSVKYQHIDNKLHVKLDIPQGLSIIFKYQSIEQIYKGSVTFVI